LTRIHMILFWRDRSTEITCNETSFEKKDL